MRGTSDGSMAYMRDPAYARFQPGPGTGDGSYAHGAPDDPPGSAFQTWGWEMQ